MIVPTKQIMVGARVQLEAPYRCAGCGHEAVVRVVGAGHGRGSDLIIETGLGERAARDEARRAAVADGAELIGLVPCPSCGRRDHEFLVAYARMTNIARAAVAAVFFAIGASVWRSTNEIMFGVLCALIPGAMVVFLVGYIRELRLEVPAGRVVFVDPEEARREAEDAKRRKKRRKREGE